MDYYCIYNNKENQKNNSFVSTESAYFKKKIDIMIDQTYSKKANHWQINGVCGRARSIIPTGVSISV